MFRSIAAILALFALTVAGTVAEPVQAFSQNQAALVGTRLNSGHRIRCSEGTRILRTRGFRNVRAIDCRGSHFLYRGDRFRRTYDVTVRARDGRITNVRTVRWRR
ncbi:putative RNA binding protein YcfA (HicA-like mRNA interferase family) [Ochrobactrum sp. 19YEA23]|nr:putative RNA binding protein YcfA (HicA-like mRNA interferase family) [Ochrobactrum sp. RH2CCR150]MDH7787182.1 putative RNA binding protein YcfA (HicA-like mRNA interferase family) [Ochrobactrum sp. 19YEA23]